MKYVRTIYKVDFLYSNLLYRFDCLLDSLLKNLSKNIAKNESNLNKDFFNSVGGKLDLVITEKLANQKININSNEDRINIENSISSFNSYLSEYKDIVESGNFNKDTNNSSSQLEPNQSFFERINFNMLFDVNKCQTNFESIFNMKEELGKITNLIFHSLINVSKNNNYDIINIKLDNN